MLKRGAHILGVKKDELQEFEVEDTFNNNNILKGVLCKRSDYRYGALILFKVNDWINPPQVIWGTPKMDYPFDKQGKFNFPAVKEAQYYDKLDGTNVVSWWYYLEPNVLHYSFKTRLTPVIKDGNFGKFYSLWCEALERYSWIKQAIEFNTNYNLSFELFGYRNPITIRYDVDLDVNLLFGIRRSDHIIVPPTLLYPYIYARYPNLYPVDNKKELIKVYSELKEQASKQNKEELLAEGMVMYAACEGEESWKQFKIKPDTITKIHWAAGGIPKHSLWTTAINVFEHKNEPTYEDYYELLKEEYTDHQINQVIVRVEKIWKEANEHMGVVSNINEVYLKATKEGFDIKKDKNATFRFMSQFFEKKQMRKVGSIILKQAGLI